MPIYSSEIAAGRVSLGIELGSTRIKAVLVAGDACSPIASGSFEWENALVDGVWSYDLADAARGVRAAWAACAADAAARHGVAPTRLAGIGVSGMMHGYLAFADDDWNAPLVPFRTWRNTMTAEAAAELSALFSFNIPQRWSIAHWTQALLRKEPHIAQVRHLTTLAGWVHHALTGTNVLGVGEASGMFPIDPATGDWDTSMLAAFDAHYSAPNATPALRSLLPTPLPAGSRDAGVLTDAGARWLDPTGALEAGAIAAPPEGDAGTGMVATNAVAPRTGNVSAGTSVFAMVVLERALAKPDPAIDVVATPSGAAVAMVHCNNCTNEINAWASLFDEARGDAGADASIHETMFRAAASADADCGGVVVVPFLSGEPVLDAPAQLRVSRAPDARFTFGNFARANIYAAFATLALGMEKLAEQNVGIDSLTGHGGIFKTRGVAQQILADAVNAPVSCLETAGEGGPWGMAVLAAYTASGATEPLETWLTHHVFANAHGETLAPSEAGRLGFQKWLQLFRSETLDARR